MQNALVLHHHVIGGATTDVDDGDRHGDTVRIEGDALAVFDDHMVVPGRQRFRDHLMEGDAGRQCIGQRSNRLLETVALFGDDFLAVHTAVTIERTDRQSRDRMYGATGETGLLQRMLHDGAIETRPGIALEMGRRTIDGTDRVDRTLRLVFENALLAGSIQVTPDCPTRAREGMAIRRPSGSATLVNA